MQINNQKNVEKEQKKIGPIAKGTLHTEMRIPQDEKIGRKRLQHELHVAKGKHDVPLERKVLFALNFGHKK